MCQQCSLTRRCQNSVSAPGNLSTRFVPWCLKTNSCGSLSCRKRARASGKSPTSRSRPIFFGIIPSWHHLPSRCTRPMTKTGVVAGTTSFPTTKQACWQVSRSPITVNCGLAHGTRYRAMTKISFASISASTLRLRTSLWNVRSLCAETVAFSNCNTASPTKAQYRCRFFGSCIPRSPSLRSTASIFLP